MVSVMLKATRAVSWLSVIAYMFYSDRNVNFLLLCGRVVAVLLGPLISLRDFIKNKNLPSYEYNVETYALTGILSYMLALWYISSDAHPLSGILNGRSKEFVALSIAGGFRSFDRIFVNFFCYPSKGEKPESTLDLYEEALSFPGLVAATLMFEYGSVDPKYTSVISAFFIYRVIRFIGDYRWASSLGTETIPSETRITHTLPRSPKKLESEQTSFVWRIYGNTYDLTDYVAHHPGGREAIMLGEGRDDCTAIFQSYHPFNIGKAKAVLEKYRTSPMAVGQTKEMLISPKHENDAFYDLLSKRVAQTLLDNGIHPIEGRAGTWLRWMWYSFVLSNLIGGCILHCKGSMLGSIWFGVFGAFIGGHIGHDGGHFSVSRIPIINEVALWGIGLISNPVVWQHQHTYGHHSFTNDNDHDPDLHHFHTVMRIQKRDDFYKVYKLQVSNMWIYFSYALTSFAECYWFTIRFIFERSMHGAVEWSDRKRLFRSFCLILHFAAYTVFVMVGPFFGNTYSWRAVLQAWVQMMLAGFLFAIFSQVGHITEQALERDLDDCRKKRNEVARDSWAADQIETTNDFCGNDPVMFHVAACLTNQIEHHLFPGLNHCHLQTIQPIVEKTCKEFNVDYKNYETFTDAFNDTLKYLHKMGRLDEMKKVA